MKKTFLIAMAIVLVGLVCRAQESRRGDWKVMEMKKIIKLSPVQEKQLRAVFDENARTNDSILQEVAEAELAAQLKYESNKKLNEAVMATLTNPQRNTYIRVTSTPEVQAKAASKVEVLRESGDYTPAQLDSAQREIFEYLMLEKVVYTRNKYDYRQQKENIAQLKKKQPARLKQAETREKMRLQKKHYQGRTKW